MSRRTLVVIGVGIGVLILYVLFHKAAATSKGVYGNLPTDTP